MSAYSQKTQAENLVYDILLQVWWKEAEQIYFIENTSYCGHSNKMLICECQDKMV